MTTTTLGRDAASLLTPRAAAIDTLPAGARLRTRDLCSLYGCSKPALMLKVAKGLAPAPLDGEYQLAWRVGDVRAALYGGER